MELVMNGEVKKTVAEKRNYRVTTVDQAKRICSDWLNTIGLRKVLSLGLPEIDDRYHIWRVAILGGERNRIGEVVIDAKTSLINSRKTTQKDLLEKGLLKKDDGKGKKNLDNHDYPISPLRNTIAYGDSSKVLLEMPAESVDLIFTSPPYYMPALNIRII